MPEIEQPAHVVTPFLLIQLTFEKWFADNMPRHAAALAYYTMFAVAPLLIIVAGIAGAFYGREAAKGQIAAQVDQYVNSPPMAVLIQSMLVSLNQSSSNLIITTVSIVALIYGASNVFGELQTTLNHIWHAPKKPTNNLWSMILQRLITIGMVVISGVLLFLSLVLSIWVTAANRWAALRFALLPEFGEWSYFLLLLGLTTLIFALIYRFVPDVRKPWHDVIVGAIATALLFSIARLLLGWYLSHTSIASTYGAAGSLALLLLWVYYSAQIFFLGAEFTQVYGQLYSSVPATMPTAAAPVNLEPLPAPNSEPVVPKVAEPSPMITPVVNNEPDKNHLAEPQPTAETVIEGEGQPSRWGRLRAVGQSLRNAGRIPLRITRPVGEIALAAGVIGVASVAALLLGSLRGGSNEDKGDEAQSTIDLPS